MYNSFLDMSLKLDIDYTNIRMAQATPFQLEVSLGLRRKFVYQNNTYRFVLLKCSWLPTLWLPKKRVLKWFFSSFCYSVA